MSGFPKNHPPLEVEMQIEGGSNPLLDACIAEDQLSAHLVAPKTWGPGPSFELEMISTSGRSQLDELESTPLF